jgi:hypothetical protein
MKIVRQRIPVADLEEMARNMFGNLVKAVVDIEQEIMAIDAELHADEEALLLESGSRQEHLWGINIYPEMDRSGPDFIEFDSMINLRPSQGNRSRGVENPEIRNRIISVVDKIVL